MFDFIPNEYKGSLGCFCHIKPMKTVTSTRLRLAAAASLAILLSACPTTKPIGGGTSTGGPTSALPPTPSGQVYGTPGQAVRYTSASFSQVPEWSGQSFKNSLISFQRGCSKLTGKVQWQAVCNQAKQTPPTDQAARLFFENLFTPWQLSDNGNNSGTVTGYYEPVLHGDTQPTSKARFPIYGIPTDFVSVPLSDENRLRKGTVRVSVTGANQGNINGSGTYTANLNAFPITERSRSIKGRVVGNQFVPYYTRAEINAGALNGKAPILAYADDAVELFFLHIQGSGRLQTPSGQFVRLGYADKNEYPFKSVATYMASKGYLPLAQTNMQGIKAWMRQNPSKLAEVLGQNPSYVFFRTTTGAADEGPIGALGAPLTGEYSAAIDKHHVELGAPIFVATTHPLNNQPHNRLIMAQDTGSAIKGGVRVDYYWGYGDAAGEVAGKMKHPGQVWMLLPNGYTPRYQP